MNAGVGVHLLLLCELRGLRPEECAFSGRWCTTYVVSHNATNRLGKKHRRIDGPAAIGDYLSPSIVARADLLRTGICMPLPSLPAPMSVFYFSFWALPSSSGTFCPIKTTIVHLLPDENEGTPPFLRLD